jgi:hypothetical protein
MTWEKLTGTPVKVQSVMIYQTNKGALLVSLDIVPRDGTVSKIFLSIQDVQFLSESFTKILAEIRERKESN